MSKFRLGEEQVLERKEQAAYDNLLREQLATLKANGWDDFACSAYNDYLKSSLKEENEAFLIQTEKQLFLVGSPLYEKLFIESCLSDKEKICLVIQQLGGFLNESNDLEMAPSKYCFDPDMAPGASFLNIFSKTVQSAYPKGLKIADSDKRKSKTVIKKSYPAETMLHQFRHQLDKHNVAYVKRYRVRHQMKTDEAAIKAILKRNWFYADPHYHNRALLGDEITAKEVRTTERSLTNRGLIKKIRKRGFYRKILSGDYHSEFIVDEAGELISQWQTEAKETVDLQIPIANGESFNYGERPRYDQTRSHNLLDGLPPHNFDPVQRLSIKKNWISPKDNWFYQLIRRLAESGYRFKKRI
jgi:hypothetical protein